MPIIYLAGPLVDWALVLTSFGSSQGCDFVASNASAHGYPSIWVLATVYVDKVLMVQVDPQQIIVIYSCLNQRHFVSFVYASVLYKSQRAFGKILSDPYLLINNLWTMVKDFSALIGAHEKVGLRLFCISCREF